MKWIFKETKQNWIFVLKSFKITRIEGWNGVGKDRKGLPFHLEDKLILFVLKFQCDKKHIANSESAVCQRLSLSHHSVLWVINEDPFESSRSEETRFEKKDQHRRNQKMDIRLVDINFATLISGLLAISTKKE